MLTGITKMPQLFAKLSGRTDKKSLPGSITTDILHLINASIRGGSWRDSKGAPAFASVMNFGNPALARFGAGSIHLAALATAIREVITMFEPRLISRSVQVTASIDPAGRDSSRPNIQWPVFCVDATIAPTNEAFRLRLRIDVVHGHAMADQ